MPKRVPTLRSRLFGPGKRREIDGWLRRLLDFACAALAAWTVYQIWYAPLGVLATTIYFLCGLLPILFLTIGATPRSNVKFPSPPDFFLAAVCVFLFLFFVSQADELSSRISLFEELTAAQKAAGAVMIAIVLEATRRSVGYGLLIVVVGICLYNLFGDRISGYFGHGPISLGHFLDISVYTVDGIFGAPVRIAATYAFVFVLFGTFLEKTGGGDFFYHAASLLTANSRGGPAKIAVISSGLFGSISGSPTSDVITTGSITIPTMKRYGYPAVLAGAIEVAASSGGSLLPPVMGAAAFFMAEFTATPYWNIALIAIVPALLYYLAVFIQIHLRTKRLELDAAVKIDPNMRRSSLAKWLLYVPSGLILVSALALGYPPTTAGLMSTMVLIALSYFWPEHRIGIAELFDGLATTVYRLLPVTAACAAAGLVIAGVTMTGLSQKFATIMLVFGNEKLLPALVISAAITIVLGMGMPTSSAYILAAILIAPTLVGTLEVPILSAHLFLFYFSVLSAMTPPIAVAAYAASAIADANPMQIGLRAIGLSAASLLIPFAIIYEPALVFAGSVAEIFWSIARMVAAIALAAAAVEGYVRGRLHWIERTAFAASALVLVGDLLWLSAVAVFLSIGIAAFHWRRTR